MNVSLQIAGMNCGHCVKAVTEALSSLPGLSSVDVEVGRARFAASAIPDEAALRAAIEDAGFELVSVSRAP